MFINSSRVPEIKEESTRWETHTTKGSDNHFVCLNHNSKTEVAKYKGISKIYTRAQKNTEFISTFIIPYIARNV